MTIYVVSELYWNYQTGAADWGFYDTRVAAAFTEYAKAENYILSQRSELCKLEWSESEKGWWKNNSIILKIEEVVLQ